MALALIATLVLTDKDRTFALRVLGTYTLASLVLNYVHGLVPELHAASVDWARLADWDPANWALVLLATSLPVGSIYFGSDLVAKVLHHRPTPIPAPVANAEESTETVRNRSTADLEESTPAPITVDAVAVPDPVAVGFLKSTLPLKPVPAIEPTPGRVDRDGARSLPSRPVRVGRPVECRTPPDRPDRSAPPAQLLDEARDGDGRLAGREADRLRASAGGAHLAGQRPDAAGHPARRARRQRA